MSRFFIHHPIFATVIAIFISLFGVLSIPLLPISQYPNVAPPSVTINTTYPGASPEQIYESVTNPIEQQLNGIEGLLYFESTSDATGLVTITVTFTPGTDIDIAQVDVQNRISRVQATLPEAVIRQGVQVQTSSSGFLMVVALTSETGRYDPVALGDYINRNVVDELLRIDGIGQAQIFTSERAMRIWLDPDKLVGLNMTPSDVISAVRAQNAQVAAGQLGGAPHPESQPVTFTVQVRGQLTTMQDFENIVLRANPDGSNVLLSDVGRVEIGAQTYTFSSRLNGKPAAAVGLQLTPSGNALAASEGVRAKMEELQKFFPAGISYSIPYDTAPFVQLSIETVLHTLAEAMLLVVGVMLIFLQNWRYTLIPAVVVPVALLGAVGALLVLGYSINVLTMFAMVLAIGILVDDGIVVVENVERIMSEEGLPPKEAADKAMGQIQGAIVGITLVLSAVFVPMAFFPGTVGVIYRQFSVTMAVSILFSGFLALTLTPALCGVLLKQVKAGHHHEKRGPAAWFNNFFDKLTHGYTGMVKRFTRIALLMLIPYLGIVFGLGHLWGHLPSGFLPNEDQGFLIVDMQTPGDASTTRTLDLIETAENVFLPMEDVKDVVAVQGYSFSGTGSNAALAFVTLTDWSKRTKPSQSAEAIAGQATGMLWPYPDGMAFALSPPPIQGLGTSNGFEFRLQDRGGLGTRALADATQELLQLGAKDPILTGMRVNGLPFATQLELIVDRKKADSFGVTFADINSAISTLLGSYYVNEFPNRGRMQQVIVMGEADSRMTTSEVLDINVRNVNGGMVPLSAFATAEWVRGPLQVVGYNGYPSSRITGNAAPGYSSGEAIIAMEKLMEKLPAGFGYEWSGQSLQEIQSGNQQLALFGLSFLFVFLLLSALYESWAIPISVMLVVPLGALGSVVANLHMGMENDVYFKVGLITIMGLSAKNAILIVEFAKELMEAGHDVMTATMEAAKLRFRPIIMTSLAFTLGVVPLATATGASAASQNAIGVAVLGGMISATLLAVAFVPVFFVAVMRYVRHAGPHDELLEHHDGPDGGPHGGSGGPDGGQNGGPNGGSGGPGGSGGSGGQPPQDPNRPPSADQAPQNLFKT